MRELPVGAGFYWGEFGDCGWCGLCCGEGSNQGSALSFGEEKEITRVAEDGEICREEDDGDEETTLPDPVGVNANQGWWP